MPRMSDHIDRWLYHILDDHHRNHKYSKLRLSDVEFALEVVLKRLVTAELRDLGFPIEKEEEKDG